MEKVTERIFKEVVEKDVIYDMNTLIRDVEALQGKLIEIQERIDKKKALIAEGVALGIEEKIIKPIEPK